MAPAMSQHGVVAAHVLRQAPSGAVDRPDDFAAAWASGAPSVLRANVAAGSARARLLRLDRDPGGGHLWLARAQACARVRVDDELAFQVALAESHGVDITRITVVCLDTGHLRRADEPAEAVLRARDLPRDPARVEAVQARAARAARRLAGPELPPEQGKWCASCALAPRCGPTPPAPPPRPAVVLPPDAVAVDLELDGPALPDVGRRPFDEVVVAASWSGSEGEGVWLDDGAGEQGAAATLRAAIGQRAVLAWGTTERRHLARLGLKVQVVDVAEAVCRAAGVSSSLKRAAAWWSSIAPPPLADGGAFIAGYRAWVDAGRPEEGAAPLRAYAAWDARALADLARLLRTAPPAPR